MPPKAKKELSELLFDFLHLLAQVQEQTAEFLEKAQAFDCLQQDYLHQLELEQTNYHSRANIASKLRQCRIDRRDAKNYLEITEPLLTFLNSDRGKVLISQLREVAGRTKKVERTVQQRSYLPRVMEQKEYFQFRKE